MTEPQTFWCPAAWRNRIPVVGPTTTTYEQPEGHARIVRTGERRIPADQMRGPGITADEIGYECECGLTSFTRNAAILGFPEEPI